MRERGRGRSSARRKVASYVHSAADGTHACCSDRGLGTNPRIYCSIAKRSCFEKNLQVSVVALILGIILNNNYAVGHERESEDT